MKTDPVTLLWHLLRGNETGKNVLTFKFAWITEPDKKLVQWAGDACQSTELMELYKQHGAPTGVEIFDSRKVVTDVYRCNICGGLVKFDGTPPGTLNEPEKPEA